MKTKPLPKRCTYVALLASMLCSPSYAEWITVCEEWTETVCEIIEVSYEEEFEECTFEEHEYTYDENSWFTYDLNCYTRTETVTEEEEVCEDVIVEDCWEEWIPEEEEGEEDVTLEPFVITTLEPTDSGIVGFASEFQATMQSPNSSVTITEMGMDFKSPLNSEFSDPFSNPTGMGSSDLGGFTDTSCYVQVSGQLTGTLAISLTPTQAGTYYVRFWVKDADGNKTYSETISFDVIAPVDINISPDNPQIITIGESLQFNSTAAAGTSYLLKTHNFEWRLPNGVLVSGTGGQSPEPGGSTDIARSKNVTGSASSTFAIQFRPTLTGNYNVRFSSETTQGFPNFSNWVPITVESISDQAPEQGMTDSNDNGIPDLVERSLGLDPASDNDADPRLLNIKRQYGYDRNNRLISAPERDYTLDAEGNIESQ